MIDGRGVPTRVPPDLQGFAPGEAASFDMHRVALPEAPRDAHRRQVRVRRRDLDPLDHVNNSVYVDYFEEALVAAGQAELVATAPRRYVLDFAASAACDDLLTGHAWAHGGGWAYRLVRSGSDDGPDIFRATVSPLSPGSIGRL